SLTAFGLRPHCYTFHDRESTMHCSRFASHCVTAPLASSRSKKVKVSNSRSRSLMVKRLAAYSPIGREKNLRQPFGKPASSQSAIATTPLAREPDGTAYTSAPSPNLRVDGRLICRTST